MSTSIVEALRTAFGYVDRCYDRAREKKESEIFDESYFGHRLYEGMAPIFRKDPKPEDLKWQDHCCGFRVDLHIPKKFAAELKWLNWTRKDCASARNIGRCVADPCRLGHICLHENINCWFILGGYREAFCDMFGQGTHRTEKGQCRRLGNPKWSPLARHFFPFEAGRVEIKRHYQNPTFRPVFSHIRKRLREESNCSLELPTVIECAPFWYHPIDYPPDVTLEERVPLDLGSQTSLLCFCAWRIATNGGETFDADLSPFLC